MDRGQIHTEGMLLQAMEALSEAMWVGQWSGLTTILTGLPMV
jgi:hypothetical protein